MFKNDKLLVEFLGDCKSDYLELLQEMVAKEDPDVPYTEEEIDTLMVDMDTLITMVKNPFNDRQLKSMSDLCVCTVESYWDTYSETELLEDEEVREQFTRANEVLDRLELFGVELPETRTFLHGRKFYRKHLLE